jgi:hypothetical protein
VLPEQAPQMGGHDAHAAVAFAQAHGLTPEQVLAFQQQQAAAVAQQQQHSMPMLDAAQLHAMHAGQVGSPIQGFCCLSLELPVDVVVGLATP